MRLIKRYTLFGIYISVLHDNLKHITVQRKKKFHANDQINSVELKRKILNIKYWKKLKDGNNAVWDDHTGLWWTPTKNCARLCMYVRCLSVCVCVYFIPVYNSLPAICVSDCIINVYLQFNDSLHLRIKCNCPYFIAQMRFLLQFVQYYNFNQLKIL